MRGHGHLRLLTGLLLILICGLCPNAARAAERVTLGSVGQASANLWPALIAIDKGFYAAEDLNVDIVYVQSSAALVQQVTAGSVGVSISTGLADPLRAVGMERQSRLCASRSRRHLTTLSPSRALRA